MTDDKERVDWSALMDAHGIEPDAETASPAVEPARREEQPADEPARRRAAARSRLVHVVVAVTALFSIAASAAVLVALLRGGDGERVAARSAGDPPMVPVGPRPAAFEQTTDGVTVVPPAAAQASPAAAESPSPAAKDPPSAAESPPPAAKKPPPAAETPPSAARKPPGAAEAPPPAAETPPSAAAEPGPPGASLPDEPDQAGVASAMAALEKDIAACAAPAKVSGTVGIKMRIDPDGSVAWASAKVQNSPFQACLDRLFKKARMPRSAKGATVRQTVALP